MQIHTTGSRERSSNLVPNASGILVLQGYGVRVTVSRGHLSLQETVGPETRMGSLARATSRLKKLVILGHSGLISFEAIQWLHKTGAAFIHVDADGKLLASSCPTGFDDARLRRAQALAFGTDSGLKIAHELIRQKLSGQAEALRKLPHSGPSTGGLEELQQEISNAKDLTQLRWLEADGASIYWRSWSNVSLEFARRDVDKVPEHWLSFGSRTSLLSGSPRVAMNPANAMLNYLYALLEADCRIALLKVGLDPGLGIFHHDQHSRDSLALDIIEAVRPRADSSLLDVLQRHTFAARDFFETGAGNCRLSPRVTKFLAELAPVWQRDVGVAAESVVKMLAAVPTDSRRSFTVPTHLTQSNRSLARRELTTQTKRRAVSPTAKLKVCLLCGESMGPGQAKYCAACRDTARKAQLDVFASSGAMERRRLRSEGFDTTMTAETKQKNSSTMKEQLRSNAAWQALRGIRGIRYDVLRTDSPGHSGYPITQALESNGAVCAVLWRHSTR